MHVWETLISFESSIFRVVWLDRWIGFLDFGNRNSFPSTLSTVVFSFLSAEPS